ncbi:MAG: S-layer homology domain-containing protein, partial [Bacillota bacterium]
MKDGTFRRIALLLCITLAITAGVGGSRAAATGGGVATGDGAAGGGDATAGSDDGIMRLTVYFVLSTENAFHLVPVGVEVPQSDKPAEAALQMLIRGAPAGSPVRSLIPSDTRLLGYSLENGTAIVDFSNEITRANVGSSGEVMLLDSIMATLAQFPGVERIRILVDGRPLDSLAGHVDITGPLPVRDIRGTSLFRGFEDAQGHWAEGPIAALYSAGVICGYPNGLFRPQGAVTRAEFVKMTITSRRGAGEGVEAGTDPPDDSGGGPGAAMPGGEFTDVADTEWYEPYVDAAVTAGILAPADYGGVFAANTPITRREVAVMLVRAANLEADAVQKRGADLPFTDTAGQPDWAKGYLAVAFEHGLMV